MESMSHMRQESPGFSRGEEFKREGLPVLAKRHGYNVEQCERLEQYDKGASFDSWEEVPELANRILGKE